MDTANMIRQDDNRRDQGFAYLDRRRAIEAQEAHSDVVEQHFEEIQQSGPLTEH